MIGPGGRIFDHRDVVVKSLLERDKFIAFWPEFFIDTFESRDKTLYSRLFVGQLFGIEYRDFHHWLLGGCLGTDPGTKASAVRIHSTSQWFRSTCARQSAVTLSLGSARLMHTGPMGSCAR